MSKPSIHIVVLTWNQCELTCACIESLFRLNYSNYEIVVVDNGSTDGTVDILLEKFGQRIVLLKLESNRGYAGGNNYGIQWSLQKDADYICILNNDTVVDNNFLGPLLRRLSANPKIGAVTPKIYYLDEPHRIWAVGGSITYWLGRASSRGRTETDQGQFDQAASVDYTTGCCFLASHKVFAEIGCFREQYFAYFEDVDWSLRVKNAGWEVWYEPQSVLWHKAGASTSIVSHRKEGNRSSYVIYLLTRNNLWFIREHIPGLRKYVALIAFAIHHVLYYSFAYLLLQRWPKLQNLWGGVIDGLKPIQ